MQRFFAATRKEFLQFSRDWLLVIFIIWLYTVEVIICTYALSFDVRNLSLAVYDQDRSQMSQELIERFTATDYFGETVFVSGPGEIDFLLDSGRADIGISIPPDFSGAVRTGESVEVQVILSGVNSNTASIARGYAEAIITRFSQEAAAERARGRSDIADAPVVIPQIRIWYNPDLKFSYFMVVSMIVVAGVFVGLIHAVATMVREKETGTMEQLILTPLKGHELIAAKLVPTFTIGLLSLLPSLGIALWFGVPLRGSVLLFFLASAINLFSSAGIGIYISTLSRNLQQGLLISFFILFPMMFLSGTMVPIESMPMPLQYLSYLSPVRYYMEITLGIFLKGVGLSVLWPEFLLLFAFGAVIFPVGLWHLRRGIYK